MCDSITELLWHHAAVDGLTAIVYDNHSTFADRCK